MALCCVLGQDTLLSSVLPKTQCPPARPGLEPEPLDPGTSALTMRPPRLPLKYKLAFKLKLEVCKTVCYSCVYERNVTYKNKMKM